MHDWQKNAWIWSKNGNKLSIINLKPDDIDIDEIAHALGNTCRFGGHCSHFYSVAEHCVIMAHLMHALGHGPDVVLASLLHDASEYMLTDVPKPYKTVMPEYERYENIVMDAICVAYGVDVDHCAIHRLDKEMVVSEANELFIDPEWTKTFGYEPINDFAHRYLAKYAPEEASFAFKEMYECITSGGDPSELIYD